MIFVTVGTSQFPFDRLVAAVDDFAHGEEVVVQRGASSVEPKRARSVPFMPYHEVAQHIQRARVVVTHAGVGSILLALQAGRRPLVVPRLARHGEAVDDHQVRTAQALAEHGRVVLVEDVRRLGDLVARDAQSSGPPAPDSSRLAEEVRDYALRALGRQPSAPPDQPA
jgi:UDP-N-acetylglucosamine transferase subunit ALG13